MDAAVSGVQAQRLCGYMLKRNAPMSPPAMQKGYFMLHGTCLLEFVSEEEAGGSFKPREEYEIIGVSNWDGKGRVNVYPNAFLVVTHLGTTLYFTCDTNVEKQAWVLSIRCALECSFANASLAHLKPPKDRFPAPERSTVPVCGKTGAPLQASGTQYCASCGRGFLAEYCKDLLPFIQLGQEQCMRVCSDCAHGQWLLSWMKTCNYHYLMACHSNMADVTKDPLTYSASVAAMRKSSRKIDMAGDLLDNGSISQEEFEELVLVEQRYNEEERNEQARRFRRALRSLGNDVHTLIMFIVDAAQNKKSPRLFEVVLERLLEIAMGNVRRPVESQNGEEQQDVFVSDEAEIEVIDFFWPQLMQLHLLLSRKITPQTIPLVDGIQTFLLLLAGRHFVLAQKLAWGLAGTLEDANSVSSSQFTHSQYTSCLSLLFQLEKVVTGTVELLEGSTSSSPKFTLSDIMSFPSHLKTMLMQHFALLFSNRSSRYVSWLRFSPNSPAPARSGEDESPLAIPPPEPSLLLMDSMAEMGPIFIKQMAFLARLSRIVDGLRFVDREQRKSQLLQQLEELELELDTLGYSPVTSASEPVMQIVKIVSDSCHVFRTKARAPSLIVAEVVQVQAAPHTRRRRHFSTEILREDEIGQLIESNQTSLMQGMEKQEHSGPEDIDVEVEENGDRNSNAFFPSKGDSYKPSETRSGFRPAHYTHDRVHEVNQHAEQIALMLRQQTSGGGPLDSIPPPMTEDPLSESNESRDSSPRNVDLSVPGETELVELRNLHPVTDTRTGSKAKVPKVERSANKLLAEGKISEDEFNLLLENDARFREESGKLDEEFCIARRFGESWTEKVARLKASSRYGNLPGWNLCSFIVKSNDDLRQEMCCMQMIELCSDIFRDANLNLTLRPYRILSTSARTGLVETLVDTTSLDALKKTENFVDLAHYFSEVYRGSAERLSEAKHAFVASLAAYCLVSYLLQIKDRHNGNILIDRDGHVVHIDFGFIMGIAPGGSFSLETAPFKLTQEMIDVLGGFRSPLFNEFVTLFVAGFVALQANAETIVKSFELLTYSSPFPCLVGQEAQRVLERFRARFRLELKREETARFCMDLIVQSYNNYGTRQYDYYQWYTNSIMP